MNSNSLPIALMQSLVTTVPLLKWNTDDTLDAMFGRSLAYLVIFSTLGMIVSPWHLVFWVLVHIGCGPCANLSPASLVLRRPSYHAGRRTRTRNPCTHDVPRC